VPREKKAKDDAEKIFLERCSACHTLERVYSKMKNVQTCMDANRTEDAEQDSRMVKQGRRRTGDRIPENT